MQLNYTEDYLILFIYNELSEAEHLAVQQAIDSNPILKNKFIQLLEVVGRLNTFTMEPSQSTIDIIVEHSLHMEEHSH